MVSGIVSLLQGALFDLLFTHPSNIESSVQPGQASNTTARIAFFMAYLLPLQREISL
jgi:hypothetical protein